MNKPQRQSKAASNGTLNQRLDLGEYIVADPLVCHGKPTYRGTRIMVRQILDSLAQGMSTDAIVKAWGGRVSKAAISETVRLAGRTLLDAQGRLTRSAVELAA